MMTDEQILAKMRKKFKKGTTFNESDKKALHWINRLRLRLNAGRFKDYGKPKKKILRYAKGKKVFVPEKRTPPKPKKKKRVYY